MSYTYEVTENIGTTGRGTFNAYRYRYHIKNAEGHIVATGYGISATMADYAARRDIERYERKGGTFVERMVARRQRKQEERAQRRG